MSVSISTAPSAIQSAYRPIIFKVASTVVAPELQIKGEIYVRPTSTAPFQLAAVKYEKKYMEEDNFQFDVSNVLKAYLTFDRLTASASPGATSPNDGSIVAYYVKFTEIYYDSDGLPQAYATLTSGTNRAVNAIPQHGDDQALSDYIITGASPDNPFGDEFGEEFT